MITKTLRVVAVVVACFATVAWHANDAHGQPVFQGSLACPAGAPTGQQAAQGLLNALIDSTKGDALNTAWTQHVEPAIENKTVVQTRVHLDTLPSAGCTSDVTHFCGTKLAFSHCSFVYYDLQMHALTGLGALRFASFFATANDRNVSSHTNRGPDASVITDGVFAPETQASTDPAYAIVLPHNGAKGAIVVDLGLDPNGNSWLLCGTGSGCTAPTIQADNDDIYQLDYSTDGAHWITYGQFPTKSGSGLKTRSLAIANFTARYMRVYGVSGGPTYAVSELQLFDTKNNLVSLGKPAFGPPPYQIVDPSAPAPATHSSTDTNYSVVLVHKPGSATALMVDLGQVVSICGNKYSSCGHEPTIQADDDDIYMFDYSLNGKDWTTYGFMDDAGAWHGTFAKVGGGGLQTRDMSCSARPDPSSACSPTNEGPDFTARYIRVYARSGGDTFAVSRVELWDTAGNPVLAPTYAPAASGPEPFFLNGEFAPEGTAWNDGHYATLLGPCTTNSSSKCPVAAASTAAPVTSALKVDLTATFPISRITIQADSNDTYQVDGSLDGVSWTNLWKVPTASGGLRTRTTTQFKTSSPQARYVRVYATAGDGNYSVSELQVFTPQANTAGAYATAEDNQDFVWSDGRANDGQNFACSYDGNFNTALGVASGSTVTAFSTLPIQFYVDSVYLNAHCVTDTDSGDYTIAQATNRQCGMTLVRPSPYGPPFTDKFQAGFCAPTTDKPQGQSLMSYMQFDEGTDTSVNNTAIQFESQDNLYGTANGSDLTCNDWSSLDPHIPDLLRGVIPAIAAGLTKFGMNEVLDFHPPSNALIPFPRDTTRPQNPPLPPYPPIQCAGALTVGQPPTAAPDNLSGLGGRATQVGSGSDSATLRIAGRFTTDQAVALDQAGVTIDALLDEIGVGELVQGAPNGLLVPVGLQALNGSKTSKGMYQTPPGTLPIVSAQIDAQNGAMTFEIDVERAKIPSPGACVRGFATARLKTSFLLVGGSEKPVWAHATANWQCNGAQLVTP